MAVSAAVITGDAGVSGCLFAQASRQAIGQDDLLRFAPKGQLTILHMTDCHAQLMPLYFCEPSVNIGVGRVRSQPPPIADLDFLKTLIVRPRGLLWPTPPVPLRRGS